MVLTFLRPSRAVLLGILAACLSPAGAQAPPRIKWACIGNSLTAGYPQANLTYVSGARRLATLIGPQDTLLNAGVSSLTLLKKGDKPYWTQGKLAQVFAFQPDIVSIELGTNDTKPENWKDSADFVKDLTALVDTLAAMPSHPDVWLMLPPPIYANTYGINDTVMTYGVIPRILQVAAARGLKVLDANTRMRAIVNSSPTTYYSDGVHFTTRGADSLAAVIYRSFLSQITRVACIGNSITAGSTLSAPLTTAYPVRLNMRLGRKFYVRNEGLSGAYMQKTGRAPYWTTAQFKDVFAFQPHFITMALGTNDSRVTQWNGARFMTDYRAMLDSLSNGITPKPKFWLLKSMPAWYATNNSTVSPGTPAWGFDNDIAGNGINGFTIRDSVDPAIQQVATERSLPVIDLYAPMLMGQPYTYNVTPSYVPDGVHPRELGHDTLSAVIYRGMLPGITALRNEGSGAPRARTARRARLVPVLSPSGAALAGLYSLDGKALPRAGKPVASGVYLVKVAEKSKNQQ